MKKMSGHELVPLVPGLSHLSHHMIIFQRQGRTTFMIINRISECLRPGPGDAIQLVCGQQWTYIRRS